MKLTYIFPALLLSVGIFGAGYFIGNMHKIGKEYDRYVQVKGLSEREVPADLAVWPMHVSLTGNNLTTLKAEIEEQNREVQDFFRSLGFSEEELSKGNTNINDLQADPYNRNAQNNPFRYIAKSEFTLRTKEVSKVQNALTASLELMSKGILLGSQNSWRPVEYIFTGLNDIKPAMIEEATKNAREVAEKFARDSQAQVGDIKTARQGLFTISDRDQNTPQIKQIRVVSTIDFHLEGG